MWHMGDGWGWWMVFGWVWMLAFWGLIAWAVYALVRRRPGESERFPGRGPNALEILDQRYARGELDEEQYEAMRQKLDRRMERRKTSPSSGGSSAKLMTLASDGGPASDRPQPVVGSKSVSSRLRESPSG